MCPQSALNTRRALEGVHGVQLVPHSPFALEEINQHGDFHQSGCESSAVGASQSLIVQRVWQQRPSCLRPIRCCLHGDENLAETIANVLTSLPFVALGIQTPRSCLKLVSCFKRQIEKISEMGRPYNDSYGYSVSVEALRDENPKLLMTASALILPVQPLMVSAVHTGMMEVAFAKRALKDPDLKMAHNVHKISSLLGGAFFFADDAFPQTPFRHAAWHLAAAIGVGTCNKLLE